MRRSLHLGINLYDPKVYGKDATLKGCVLDALNMDNLAFELGYEERVILLDKSATLDQFRKQLKLLSSLSKPGDSVLISYSCHGTQVKDYSGEEPDGKDEAICLHDTLLYDDEFVALLSEFREGVDINVCSDTCHSQDQVRAISFAGEQWARPKVLRLDAIPRTPETRGAKNVSASVIQYAACKSTEVAWDLGDGGAFTKALLRVAREQRSKKSAPFLNAIARLVKNQTPSLTMNNASRSHRLKKALT